MGKGAVRGPKAPRKARPRGKSVDDFLVKNIDERLAEGVTRSAPWAIEETIEVLNALMFNWTLSKNRIVNYQEQKDAIEEARGELLYDIQKPEALKPEPEEIGEEEDT